jgi:hypothetical protein
MAMAALMVSIAWSRRVAFWALVVAAIPLLVDGIPTALVPWTGDLILRGPAITAGSVAGFAEVALGLLGLVLIGTRLVRRARTGASAAPEDDPA